VSKRERTQRMSNGVNPPCWSAGFLPIRLCRAPFQSPPTGRQEINTNTKHKTQNTKHKAQPSSAPPRRAPAVQRSKGRRKKNVRANTQLQHLSNGERERIPSTTMQTKSARRGRTVVPDKQTPATTLSPRWNELSASLSFCSFFSNIDS
jgi:hypothetical protein